MSRAYLAFWFAAGLWAQTDANVFEKAPPEVDEALRARISGFFQDHMDGKFRHAEQYVAEDTKDFYYEANKPTYLDFRIDKIVYSDNFTKAKATVICKMRFNFPGFTDKPMDAPVPSTWKIENGQWFWYVDLSQGRETPFGRMKPPKGGTPQSLPDIANAPTISSITQAIRADKNEVRLSASAPAVEQVLIANSLPGTVTLRMQAPSFQGLRVTLDRTELRKGEVAHVSFTWNPGPTAPPKSLQVLVVVEPVNTAIPISVSIN